jgi:hypothetical protein
LAIVSPAISVIAPSHLVVPILAPLLEHPYAVCLSFELHNSGRVRFMDGLGIVQDV